MLGRLDFYNDMLNYWTIPLLVAFFIFFMGCVWGWYGNSASLASLTRETGPKVVKGDPARKAEGQKVAHSGHSIHDTFDISDSALKFTHVLYNLSPAGIFLYLSLSLSQHCQLFLFCINVHWNWDWDRVWSAFVLSEPMILKIELVQRWWKWFRFLIFID